MNVSISGKHDDDTWESRIPSAYRAGYKKASALNPELAAKYIQHTVVDDPVADAVIEALAAFDHRESQRFINAGMEQDARGLGEAPRPLRDFFEEVGSTPAWFDPDAVLPGRHAFQRHLDLFIPAFVAVTLRNFTSLMSKVFLMTGQVTTQQGVRRIRQNLRYLVEMLMFPNALERPGESWKFSLRIRLLHAEIRQRLRTSGQWDEAIYGAPVSAANMALASANFSASSIQDVDRLGANLNADARASIMQIWRYASWLIGTPEALLFDGDEAETTEFVRIAHLCEPPPNEEWVKTSNAVIYLLPEVARLTDRSAKRSMVQHAYRVSRALIGDKVADQLRFPRQRTSGLLMWLRCKARLYRTFRRLAPHMARKLRVDPFVLLLDTAMIDNPSYQLPDQLETVRASLAKRR
ncbi:MAG: oxygenase MpaB family protein [Nitrospira sp.]|nr:oxygenase MpaB family protein [Nitrospira sp.]MDE0404528.1 oxygenase MpaB family protein [Nitrospira sp.]MDE0486254.1 oxygenase MpaB family protein [Nitrospira sp.]